MAGALASLTCRAFFRSLLISSFALSGCGSRRDEAEIRKELQTTGSVLLPSGITEIHADLRLPDGAHDIEITGNGSILRAAHDFHGRAIFSSKSGARIRFRNFTIDGNRDAIEQRAGLPDFSTPFHRFTSNNGILIEGGVSLSITGVTFRRVSGFPILVSGSKQVYIERVVVEDSGSRNAAGRNNTTGGILLEEGAADFQV